MKKSLIWLWVIFNSFLSFSQTKILTLEDAMVKNRTSLAVENLKQLQFLYGAEDYVYLKKVDEKEVWMRGNLAQQNETEFLSLATLNLHLRTAGLDTLVSMPPVQFNKSANWLLNTKNGKLAYNAVSKTISVIIPRKIAGKENVEESPAGWVAYVDSFNLHVAKGTSDRQVTFDGSSDIVYAASVHQNEFGITKGTFWSNGGKQLAFYRMDQTMVPPYPIIDWSVRPAKVNNVKYPMAGDKSHHVTVGIYNAENDSLVYVQTGEPAEQYLTNIAWSPDDKFLFIAILNREQNHLKLNKYDAATGLFVATLFEEKDDKYVEPLVPMLFVKNNPNQFVWQSNRDGWNHLYLYDINGNLVRQITKGEWTVVEVKGFDEKGEKLLYVSTEGSPLSKKLFSVDVKTGKTKVITNAEGIHTIQISSSGKSVLDNISSASVPRQIQLIDIKSSMHKVLLNAKSPLADYMLGAMEIFTVANKEGTPLYCRMFKPVDFDSTVKYPVVVYWYGGPHNQMINAGFNGGAGDYWFQYLAERGFVVFTIDVRGSSFRGKAFEQSIFRRAGEAQMEDLMSGVQYLHSLSFVDKNKMGLFGWSYGGFMTIDFMLTHPGIFKAAVAGGPVIDWSYYEIMYGERYMDMPKENPEGYAATDLTKRVDRLNGKLLVIHGMQDPVVVQQHSVKFVRSAIDKNVQVDYMIYPGHEHNVLGKDRAHLYQKVTDYLTQYLK